VININACSDRMYPYKFFPSLRQIVCSSCLSSFIFSIHFPGCLPWFLCPVMEQCITFTGSCSLPIFDTCPNHVSLCCAVLSINVLSWCRVLRTLYSHFSFGRALSLATISLATSSLPLGFFVRLPFSDTSIPSRTTHWNYEGFIQLHFSRIWNIFKVK